MFPGAHKHFPLRDGDAHCLHRLRHHEALGRYGLHLPLIFLRDADRARHSIEHADSSQAPDQLPVHLRGAAKPRSNLHSGLQCWPPDGCHFQFVVHGATHGFQILLGLSNVDQSAHTSPDRDLFGCFDV